MTDLHAIRAEAVAAFRKLEWFECARQIERGGDVVAMSDLLQRDLSMHLRWLSDDPASQARLRVAADALDRLARCLRQTEGAA